MTDSHKYHSKLHGSRILIIGGSSGIGFAVAEAFLEQGAYVTISSSQQSRIDSAIESLLKDYPSKKSHLQGFACDLSDPSSLESNIETLFSKAGKLDHVIHTAGDALSTLPIAEASFDKIQQAGMVRFFAPLLIAKHAANVLPKTYESSITITTGSVSERPMPNWSIINSYATGIHGMVRGLALDLAPIRVNGVSPGAVETPLWKMDEAAMQKMKESYAEKTTTGRMGQASDVAESYVYAVRDYNTSGTMIRTDGGGMMK